MASVDFVQDLGRLVKIIFGGDVCPTKMKHLFCFSLSHINNQQQQQIPFSQKT